MAVINLAAARIARSLKVQGCGGFQVEDLHAGQTTMSKSTHKRDFVRGTRDSALED